MVTYLKFNLYLQFNLCWYFLEVDGDFGLIQYRNAVKQPVTSRFSDNRLLWGTLVVQDQRFLGKFVCCDGKKHQCGTAQWQSLHPGSAARNDDWRVERGSEGFQSIRG